jgi:hypothetical protein
MLVRRLLQTHKNVVCKEDAVHFGEDETSAGRRAVLVSALARAPVFTRDLRLFCARSHCDLSHKKKKLLERGCRIYGVINITLLQSPDRKTN